MNLENDRFWIKNPSEINNVFKEKGSKNVYFVK